MYTASPARPEKAAGSWTATDSWILRRSRGRRGEGKRGNEPARRREGCGTGARAIWRGCVPDLCLPDPWSAA